MTDRKQKGATRFEFQKRFLCLGLKRGRIRGNSHPRIIPKIRMTFRGSKLVPSMG
jgi:hypothetical protein